MFLMDWTISKTSSSFPPHDTAKFEAIPPEADEADPSTCGDDYPAGSEVEAMKTTVDNKQGKRGNYSLDGVRRWRSELGGPANPELFME